MNNFIPVYYTHFLYIVCLYWICFKFTKFPTTYDGNESKTSLAWQSILNFMKNCLQEILFLMLAIILIILFLYSTCKWWKVDTSRDLNAGDNVDFFFVNSWNTAQRILAVITEAFGFWVTMVGFP